MGAMHRRIAVVSRSIGDDAAEARAVVEDDFHHFRVAVRRRGQRVSEVYSHALRNPTVLCPSAGERLVEIVGMPLSAASVAVHEQVDARQQCTHMIDLAGLAVAALAQQRPRRLYEAVVPDRIGGRTRATLSRDGFPVLAWDMDGATVTGPHLFAGLEIGTGFTGWVRERLSLDEAEAALVLRRAVFISGGRGINLDAPGRRAGPMGGCWVWQPQRAAGATRNVGSTLDFTGRVDALIEDDQAWLDFADV